MGKSKHRKNHKRKLAQYKMEMRDGARRHAKFLVELRNKYLAELGAVNTPEGAAMLNNILPEVANTIESTVSEGVTPVVLQ